MRSIRYSCFLLLVLVSFKSYSQTGSSQLSAVGIKVESIKITELKKIIDESKTPLIVNFWATFCIPCLEEIPYFQEAVEKNKESGIRLLLVSLDMQEAYPATIASTIEKRNITAPVRWLNETNADYFCPFIDKSWSGGMPSSLFVNNKTGYRRFFEEQLSKERLYKQIDSVTSKIKLN